MRPLLSCLLLLLFISGQGQIKDTIPPFGKVEKSDLLMKQCDFDKNAEAVVLLEVGDVRCFDYAYSTYTEVIHRVRIKILKDKGLQNADIKIPYFSFEKTESIGNIEGQTYNLDASGNLQVTKLDKKAIFDKEVNKKISQKIFTFPEVKVGSIIEYTYKITGTVDAGLQTWEFQNSIPVRFSRYSLDFPIDIEVRSQAFCSLPYDRQSKSDNYHTVTVFTMNHVPAMLDEPYISAEDDYLQRIESDLVAITVSGKRYPLMGSWPGVVNDLMKDEDFGMQLTKSIPRTDDLEASLKHLSDPYQKMTTIFRYVRSNMNWDGRTNIWALNGVKSAWKEKKGTSGEINLILINLLKDAGLDAHPILVSTRENGKVNEFRPTYHQFDKVMAYVQIKESIYVLDATDKTASPKLIPWDVMLGKGLVIEKFTSFEWGWKFLWDEKQTFRDVILVNGTIDDKGIMSGTASLTSFDFSRAQKMKDLEKGKDRFLEKYFSVANNLVHIDSLQIENRDLDTLPLIQKLQFTQKLNGSGDYRYFNTNLFTGFEKNPFTADTRFSDISFGANQNYTIVGGFIIPDGYSFEELPKNVRMIMPDTSIVFTRMAQADHDNLSIRMTLVFKKPFFSVDDYEGLREFYKKMFGFFNEQIVIKKNH
jgi:hypothetical protein